MPISTCMLSLLLTSMHFSFLLKTYSFIFSKRSTYWVLFKESEFVWSLKAKHTKLDLYSVTDHLQKGWHTGDSLRGRNQLSSISFNPINETAICITFLNTLLHVAHTFSIYSQQGRSPHYHHSMQGSLQLQMRQSPQK